MDPKNIEPRILPLVEALNATGLVRTFSSCEGHFGDTNRDEIMDREKATVAFELLPGVVEAQLGSLFHHVFEELTSSPHALDTVFSVSKRYSPYWNEHGDGVAGIEENYWFTMSPFDRWSSPETKRSKADGVIKLVAAAVANWRP